MLLMLTGGFIARCCCSLPLPIHICVENSNMGVLLSSIPLCLDRYALDGGQGAVRSSHSSLSPFHSFVPLSSVDCTPPRSLGCEISSFLFLARSFHSCLPQTLISLSLLFRYPHTNEHIRACIYTRTQKEDVTAINFRGHGSLSSWVRGCRCCCCVDDNNCFKRGQCFCDFNFDVFFFFF